MKFTVQSYTTDGLKPPLRKIIQVITVCVLSLSLSTAAFAQLEKTQTTTTEERKQEQTKLAPLKIQTDRSISMVVDIESHYRALTKSTAPVERNIDLDAAKKAGIALSVSEKSGLLLYTPTAEGTAQTFSYEICETEPFTATSALQYTRQGDTLVATVSVVRKGAAVAEKLESKVLNESEVLTRLTEKSTTTEKTEAPQKTEIPQKTETQERTKVIQITATTTGFEAEARMQLEATHKLTADMQKKLLATLAEGESTEPYTGETSHIDKANCASGDVEVTVNAAPQLVADKATTDQGTAVTIDVTANDAELGNLDLASLSIMPSETAIPGKLAVDAKTGLIRFVPEADFSGETSFQYQVCNRYANTELAKESVVRRATLYAKIQSEVVAQKEVLTLAEREAAEYSAEQPHLGECAMATVTVVVNPQAIDAVNDKVATDMGKAVVLDLTANDIDLKNLDLASISLVKNPEFGTVELDAKTGLMLYTPKAGYTGSDSLT